MSVKFYMERGLPAVLYLLHMLTSLRIQSYRRWKEDGSPTPFLPRGLQDAVKQHEREKRQHVGDETVIRNYGMERSRPCRRFTSFPISHVRPHSRS